MSNSFESAKYFWSSNLKFLRNRKKVSQDDLATALNWTRTKLNSHERGDTKNPTLPDLVAMSSYFKISIDMLVREDLSKIGELKLRELETGSHLDGGRLRILVTTVDDQGKQNIEVVTQKAQAGYPSGYGDPDFIASLPLASLPQLDSDNRKYRMFPITGDSMLPIPSGSDVIVEYVEDWTAVKSGTPCVVIKTDGIVFKIVHNLIAERGALVLESLNPLFAPYEVPAEKVLEVWKFNRYISKQLPDKPASLETVMKEISKMRREFSELKKGIQ